MYCLILVMAACLSDPQNVKMKGEKRAESLTFMAGWRASAGASAELSGANVRSRGLDRRRATKRSAGSVGLELRPTSL